MPETPEPDATAGHGGQPLQALAEAAAELAAAKRGSAP